MVLSWTLYSPCWEEDKAIEAPGHGNVVLVPPCRTPLLESGPRQQDITPQMLIPHLCEEGIRGGHGDPDVPVHGVDDGLELGVDLGGVARVACTRRRGRRDGEERRTENRIKDDVEG